jgi:hypothetical protein
MCNGLSEDRISGAAWLCVAPLNAAAQQIPVNAL